jgi:tRNA threonylcarbamoyl adenosine modification protein YeaZ
MTGIDTAKNILVIDSSYALTVGIAGYEPLFEPDTRSHVERITPMIEQALSVAGLQSSDITDVVCASGPGPYTGLRAGIVAAEAFGFAAHAKVSGVDILKPQALWSALRHRGDDSVSKLTKRYVLAVNDARRKQLYYQLFSVALGSDIAALTVMDIDYPVQIAAIAEKAVESAIGADTGADVVLDVIGQGASKYHELLDELGSRYQLGDVVDGSIVHDGGIEGLTAFAQLAIDDDRRLEPLYLRRPDVSLPPPLKSVLETGKEEKHER